MSNRQKKDLADMITRGWIMRLLILNKTSFCVGYRDDSIMILIDNGTDNDKGLVIVATMKRVIGRIPMCVSNNIISGARRQ